MYKSLRTNSRHILTSFMDWYQVNNVGHLKILDNQGNFVYKKLLIYLITLYVWPSVNHMSFSLSPFPKTSTLSKNVAFWVD